VCVVCACGVWCEGGKTASTQAEEETDQNAAGIRDRAALDCLTGAVEVRVCLPVIGILHPTTAYQLDEQVTIRGEKGLEIRYTDT
jgi:hypothetical protein